MINKMFMFSPYFTILTYIGFQDTLPNCTPLKPNDKNNTTANKKPIIKLLTSFICSPSKV